MAFCVLQEQSGCWGRSVQPNMEHSARLVETLHRWKAGDWTAFLQVIVFQNLELFWKSSFLLFLQACRVLDGFWRPDLRDQVELPKTGEVALRGVGKHLAILMHPGTAPSNVAGLAASVGFGSCFGVGRWGRIWKDRIG